MEEIIQEIKELIGRGREEQALEKALQAARSIDESTERIFYNLKNDLQKLKRNEMIGIVSYSQAGLQRRTIVNSLLESLELLKDPEPAPTPPEPPVNRNLPPNPPPPDPTRPKTILFLSSNPKGTDRLELEREFAQLHNVVQNNSSAFIVKSEWAVTVLELQNLIIRHRPNILHFSGHGMPDRDLPKDPATRSLKKKAHERENGIILEGPNGETSLVSASALSSIFELFAERYGIEAVILNACYVGEQAEALSEHVPLIIGMKNTITDEAAIHFSKQFYATLAAENDLEFAFKVAKNQLNLFNLDDKDVPVMKSRN